jgi:predicted nucleotidyltransferase
MPTAFDLTHVGELRELAEVLRAVHGAADSEVERWLIVGATARDLILHHVYRLPEGRRTDDLDIAIAVATWQIFESVEKRLVAAGAEPDPHARHRFQLRGWKMDVLPFGGVDEDGVIIWPPDNDITMSVRGFEEVSLNALEILPAGWCERIRRLARRPAHSENHRVERPAPGAAAP